MRAVIFGYFSTLTKGPHAVSRRLMWPARGRADVRGSPRPAERQTAVGVHTTEALALVRNPDGSATTFTGLYRA
jgi:hypothetical protein